MSRNELEGEEGDLRRSGVGSSSISELSGCLLPCLDFKASSLCTLRRMDRRIGVLSSSEDDGWFFKCPVFSEKSSSPLSVFMFEPMFDRIALRVA